MVFAVLEEVSSTMRFARYAQDWLGIIRLVLGNRCTVMLLLVVTIQSKAQLAFAMKLCGNAETCWESVLKSKRRVR